MASTQRTRLEQYLYLCRKQFENSGRELTYRDFVCGCFPNMGVRSRAIDVYKKRLVCTDAQLEALLLLYRVGDRRKLSSLGIELEAPHSGIAFVGMNCPAEALELITQFAPLHGNVLPTNYTLNFIDFGSRLPSQTELHCPAQHRMANFANILIPFMRIEMAPPSMDLIWSNIVSPSCKNFCFDLRLISMKIILFWFVFLLTVPTYLLTILTFVGIQDWMEYVGRAIILKVIPAGLLVITAIIILRITKAIQLWFGHLTKSRLEKSILRNGFWLLFVVILLLPTIGILGAPALYFYFVGFKDHLSSSPSLVTQFRPECIFLPDTAILFVNFLVTLGILGSGLQLLRLRYWFKLWLHNSCLAHSRAETRPVGRELPPYEFHFGESHAWIALVQTIIVAYTPVCPIIWFFGLVAYLFKFMVDKYMLVWVYKPKEIEEASDSTSNMTDAMSEQYLRIYHLNWALESARLSLVGICLGCFNQVVFFGLRYPVYKQWDVLLASAILGFVTLLASVIFSLLFSKSKWNYVSLLHSNPLLNNTLNSRRHILLQRDSRENLTDLGSYSSQDAYTIPVLLKYNTDKSWYAKGQI